MLPGFVGFGSSSTIDHVTGPQSTNAVVNALSSVPSQLTWCAPDTLQTGGFDVIVTWKEQSIESQPSVPRKLIVCAPTSLQSVPLRLNSPLAETDTLAPPLNGGTTLTSE